jgi:UrcA family protein
LLAAGALSFAIAAPSARAQSRYDGVTYYRDGSDDVIIEAPRHFHERSRIGAPIEDVALSRVVRYNDLDLRTDWGAHELKARVTRTAASACDELDVRYPFSTPDSPPCYATAVHFGIRDADYAIAHARGWRASGRRRQ